MSNGTAAQFTAGRSAGGYQVGIDLGTTWSAAAVCRLGVDTPEVVPLGQHSRAVASAVYSGADGTFLIGDAAERRALSDPGRVVREFKRRIGDPTPVLVGREPVAAEELAARFISRLLEDVATRERAVASRVAVTHPAGWGQHKIESLRAALAEHGLASAQLLSEPQAAAVGYASAERVEPGAVVAVYDLGGGTFDAAVVRKSAAGGFDLLGTPEGIERLGGVDFDEVVFSHVRAALGPAWDDLDPTDPEVLVAVAALRRECTAAKEALSHDTDVLVPVLLPGLGTQVRLGRAEFEEMIRPAVLETVEAMRRAIDSAGVAAGELTALLLVGGSSRIPLVTQLVSAEFGRTASVDVDPKGVIAAGAALVARGAARPTGSTAAPAAAPPGAAPRGTTPPAGTALPGPAVRPPKQARPFGAGAAAPVTSRRRTVLGLVAGAVVLALLGGAVAFGAIPIGAGRDAGAATPAPAAVTGVLPAPTPAAPVITSTPAPSPPARATKPPARAARPAPQAPPAPATAAVPPPAPAPTTTSPPATTQNPKEPGPENGGDVNEGTGDGGEVDGGDDSDGDGIVGDSKSGAAKGGDPESGEATGGNANDGNARSGGPKGGANAVDPLLSAG